MKHTILITILIALLFATVLIAQNSPGKSNSETQKKISYSYVVEQRRENTITFYAAGSSVSTKLENAIEKSKYREDVLDLMGSENWELVSVTMREFQTMLEGGLETIYYFKK